jgi:hypothetical protein
MVRTGTPYREAIPCPEWEGLAIVDAIQGAANEAGGRRAVPQIGGIVTGQVFPDLFNDAGHRKDLIKIEAVRPLILKSGGKIPGTDMGIRTDKDHRIRNRTKKKAINRQARDQEKKEKDPVLYASFHVSVTTYTKKRSREI